MRLIAACVVSSLMLSVVKANTPTGSGGGGGGGYSYTRPSGSFGGGLGRTGGGGYSEGGYSSNSGSYVPVPPAPSTYEGQYVDPKLLDQVRQVILNEESKSSSSSSGSGSFGGGYPPATSYGAPSNGGYAPRVTGIELEGVKPAIQVAQYEQSSGSGGYSGSGRPSMYGASSQGSVFSGGSGSSGSLSFSASSSSNPSSSY